MTLKKHSPLPEDENSEPRKKDDPLFDWPKPFDYDKEQAKILGVDNPTSVTATPAQEASTPTPEIDVQALIDAVTKDVKKSRKIEAKAKQDEAMGAVDPDEYTKAHPGVTHFPSSDRKAYTGVLTPKQKEELIERLQARTATPADMALIDESMILDLPYIKASDFSIPGQYDPKPKDPSIRFRWVNCVNALQSNMQRFLALGFTPASRDDVNEDKTPLAESMIHGSEIKQYDVILMKINVIQLMALYKRNIMDSAYKLDAATSGKMGEATANQAFSDLLNNDPDAQATGAKKAIGRYREAAGREPVTFSRQ
jgi:hypothetical protein